MSERCLKKPKWVIITTIIYLMVINAGCETRNAPAPKIKPSIRPSVTRLTPPVTGGSPGSGNAPTSTEATITSTEPQTEQSFHTDAAPTPPTISPTERWELIRIGNVNSGYVHTQWSREPSEQGNVNTYKQATKMRLARFGETVEQTVSVHSRERVDGQVIECGWKVNGAGQNNECQVTYEKNKFRLRTTTGDSTKTRTIQGQGFGYFHVEQSLLKNPLTAGEHRTIQALLPVFNAVAEFDLAAVEMESTDMLGSQRQLLRINCRMRFSGTEMQFVMWVDEDGHLMKQFTPGVDQVITVCDKETALNQKQTDAGNLGSPSLVSVKNAPQSVHSAQRITYRIKWRNGIPIEFPTGDTQEFRITGSDRARITIRAIRPEKDHADAPQPADFLRPSNSIQSNHRLIKELANPVEPISGHEPQDWRLAIALERKVHETITRKDFSQLFASAAEVARSKRGDCTEHAVLLAAMCRARKIPARVVSGLVYIFGKDAFGFHMWNEVWIQGKWIPLDATLALGGTGGGHLKLAEEHPNEDSGMSSMMAVMNAIGQMELEVVSFEP